ncbi:hypothetical protein ACEZCY_11660 [Streptacidiphilus sp. N1-12]|uniref:Uncharacterized protein n=2 Tax=Streptacidiphilus alkalitolerans TaxID=3342712 RepID=A0ABV6V601_9ACTN
MSDTTPRAGDEPVSPVSMAALLAAARSATAVSTPPTGPAAEQPRREPAERSAPHPAAA